MRLAPSSLGAGAGFEKRVGVMCFLMSYNENYERVLGDLNKVGNGCGAITKSSCLGAILKKVLAVGNLVNEGAGRPKVAGITIDSLMKTSLTMGIDKITSVLDYVVKMVNERTPEGEVSVIEQLGKELSCLIDGSRVSVGELKRSSKEIEANVGMVEKAMAEAGAGEFASKCEEFLVEIEAKMENLKGGMVELDDKIKGLTKFFAEGERAKRASLDEDEHTRDGSRELAADGCIHY